MDTIPWPVQSPDLNLIQALQIYIVTELEGTWGRISNIPVLEETIAKLWETILAERLDSLIRTMLERLQVVINVEGGATHYQLINTISSKW